MYKLACFDLCLCKFFRGRTSFPDVEHGFGIETQVFAYEDLYTQAQQSKD